MIYLQKEHCILVLCLLSVVGCSDTGGVVDGWVSDSFDMDSAVWEFADSSQYTYDSDKIVFSGGRATLKGVDTQLSGTDFLGGTHVGTSYSGGVLSLNPVDLTGIEISSLWVPTAPHLVAHWSLNGSWQDSVRSHHGTSSGVTFSGAAKLGSQAADFSGAGNYVSVPNHADLKPANISVSLWFKSTNPGAFSYLIGKLQDAGAGFSSYALYSGASANLIFYITTSGGLVFSPEATGYWDNFWHHALGTFDGTTVRLYVDGQEINNGTANVAPIVYSNDPLYLGSFDSGSFEYGGSLDDIAIWSEALSAEDASTIYNRQKQKYVGYFDSPIIDLGATADWTYVEFESTLPFYKELPGSSGSEISTQYPSVFGNLMGNLLGLWHFNGSITTLVDNEVINDSSLNGNNGQAKDVDVTNTMARTDGPFSQSVQFDGSNDYIEIPDSATNKDFTSSEKISTSFWLKRTTLGTWQTVLAKVGASSMRRNYELAFSDVTYCVSEDALAFVYRNSANSSWVAYCTTSTFKDVRSWHHYALTYTFGDAGSIRIYVDGELIPGSWVSGTGSEDPISTLNGSLLIGSNSVPNEYLAGAIDELALWNRSLGVAEVVELYRRGANRIKFQVRSCDDSACSGESWLGPDGTNNTYFSELQNNSTIDGSGNPTGSVLRPPLRVAFSDFNTAGLTVQNNRYFQYRVTLESDDENNLCSIASPCMPELKAVTVGPLGRYFGGSPSITNKTGVSYKTLKDLTIQSEGTCTPRYQLSNDGTSFYYWDGSQWALASDSVSQTSLGSDVSSNLLTFTSLVGAGTFFYKAFLTSNTSQTCSLNSVTLEYNKSL
jgi:hypothetical protein